jgi:hypothetical protein
MFIARSVVMGVVATSLGLCHAYAQQGESSRPKEDCFFLDEFQSWRAPDPNTIYIRVRPDRYYRLNLAGQCNKLQRPGSHLITNSHGKRTICSALDWDLSVAEPTDGTPEQCIVRSMTKLTPDQTAAIPKLFKP